jgi:hypothetical protein
MTNDRDACDEQKARLDYMIDEFRRARTRRLMKAEDKAVKSQESDRHAAVTEPATSH